MSEIAKEIRKALEHGGLGIPIVYTWLRTLLEENERLRNVLAETSINEKLLRADVKMFRDELDRLKKGESTNVNG